MPFPVGHQDCDRRSTILASCLNPKDCVKGYKRNSGRCCFEDRCLRRLAVKRASGSDAQWGIGHVLINSPCKKPYERESDLIFVNFGLAMGSCANLSAAGIPKGDLGHGIAYLSTRFWQLIFVL